MYHPKDIWTEMNDVCIVDKRKTGRVRWPWTALNGKELRRNKIDAVVYSFGGSYGRKSELMMRVDLVCDVDRFKYWGTVLGWTKELWF